MGGHVTWNIRDSAMVDMIDHALNHHDKKRDALGYPANTQPSKVIVWAHNSHIGDSRATEHHGKREHNVGDLCRVNYGMEHVFNIGFTTNSGTVRAATSWGGKDQIMELNEGLDGSVENLLSRVKNVNGLTEFGILLRDNSILKNGLTRNQIAARENLSAKMLERFIGVQYIKRTERYSHYSYCKVAEEFDFVIHVDETSALKPLQKVLKSPVRPGTTDYSKWENIEIPEEEMEHEIMG